MPLFKLIELLKNEIGFYNSLISILQEEKASLLKRSPEEMYSVLNKKEALIARIKMIEDAVSEYMKMIAIEKGLSSDNLTLSSIISSETPSNSRVLKEYQSKLISLTESIKELNEINGRAINVSLENVRKSLDFLRGFTGSIETYKPSGMVASNSVGEHLSKGV